MLSKGSFQDNRQPPRNPRADGDAASVPSGNDATRMRRMGGISAVAGEHTTGTGTSASYADGSLPLGSAKPTAGKRGNVAPVTLPER